MGAFSDLTTENKLVGRSLLEVDVEFVDGKNRLLTSSSTTASSVDKQFQQFALNGSSSSMVVDGSVTPVTFTIPADPTLETVILGLRFFGQDNGIKNGQFLGINSSLTNGISLSIKSNDQSASLIATNIKNTEDFKHLFVSSASNWDLDIQSGRDDFTAIRELSNPIILKPQGTFGTDDFVSVTINDNLTSIISLEFLVEGFKE